MDGVPRYALVFCFGLLLALLLALQGCESEKEPDVDVAAERVGSFLVLGDWGWDSSFHGNVRSRACQQAVADAMAAKQRDLGDVRFVLNVGDSFYPNGVANKSDPQWDSKWRNVYSAEVRSVPWYSVYGNHDYVGDPCVCEERTDVCAQINRNASNLDFFQMRETSYYVELPDLDVEIIALDLNFYAWRDHTCRWTSCPKECALHLKRRADATYDMLYKRAEESKASTLLIFSHYTTDYFVRGTWPLNYSWTPTWLTMQPESLHPRFSDFMGVLSNASRRHI